MLLLAAGLAGYVASEVVSRAVDAGADDVLKKPLLRHDLAFSLARVLRGSANGERSA